MKMKKVLAALFIVCLILSTLALAETKSFRFVVIPTNTTDEYQVGAREVKSDNEQRFYVTTTSNGFPDNRAMFYISCNDSGALISNTVRNTGNATYKQTAPKDKHYKLAYRTGRKPSDPETMSYIVEGRWTP